MSRGKGGKSKTKSTSRSDYDDDLEFERNYGKYRNRAGAFGGGYDDIYLDVMEEAGYDAWDIGSDIGYPEFQYDDETPMFEFDPFSEYFDLKNEDDIVMITYQALSELADMTAKLLVAWEKRAAVEHNEIERQNSSLFDDDEGLNLYQLEMEERSDLRSYSVWKLEMLLGGYEEVMRLKQVIENIYNFVKRIILTCVGNSLPFPMPYPVINTILSYLLPVRGALNIGQVTSDDLEGERKDMERLYLAMAEVFDHVKVIMFNCEPNTLINEPSITEKKEMLVEKFEVLVARVTSTQLEASFEGLDMKDTGSEGEKVSK